MMITASNSQTSVSDSNSPKTSIVDRAVAPVEMGAGRKRSRAPLLRRDRYRQLGHCIVGYGFTCEMTMRREGTYLGMIEPSGAKLRGRERGSSSASCTSLWLYCTPTSPLASLTLFQPGP